MKIICSKVIFLIIIRDVSRLPHRITAVFHLGNFPSSIWSVSKFFYIKYFIWILQLKMVFLSLSATDITMEVKIFT